MIPLLCYCTGNLGSSEEFAATWDENKNTIIIIIIIIIIIQVFLLCDDSASVSRNSRKSIVHHITQIAIKM
jgi:hypothetical protein